MAEAKQSGRMVLRKKTKSSLMFNKVKSSSNNNKRLTRGNEDNGNDKKSTSHKDALKCQSEFSHEDDLLIICFLLESSRYMKADRREIWVKMSSEKVTKHSWLKMKDRYKQVIQPMIDKYPIPKKDANKLRSSRPNDNRKASLKYQLRSTPPKRDGVLVTENFRKQSDDDVHSWSPIKRHCQSEGQCNSRKKARHLTSRSSAGDFVADAAQNAVPKYKRMKASDLQLKVINLGNEKCTIKRETVSKQYTKTYKKCEGVPDASQNATEFDDLPRHKTLLSDVSLDESTEERLKTTKRDKNIKCVASLIRNKITRRSLVEESAESDLRQYPTQTDTSFSEELFSADETLGKSEVSYKLLETSKDTGKNPAGAAGSSDDHQQPTALPLVNDDLKILPTNYIKNFILSDSPGDCIEVSDTEKTEDLTVEQNEETEKHLLVCQKLMTWLNVSPEVFAQTVLLNSGSVDDGVHWLLFNKTASGDTIWNLKDDKDLLNGDEEIYKLLEKNYGEMLILKRQQFLAKNSSSLHV